MSTSPPVPEESRAPAPPDQVEWEAYPWESAGAEQGEAARNARVADIARWLIARERGRTRRSQPLDAVEAARLGGLERPLSAKAGPR